MLCFYERSRNDTFWSLIFAYVFFQPRFDIRWRESSVMHNVAKEHKQSRTQASLSAFLSCHATKKIHQPSQWLSNIYCFVYFIYCFVYFPHNALCTVYLLFLYICPKWRTIDFVVFICSYLPSFGREKKKWDRFQLQNSTKCFSFPYVCH